MRAVGPDPAIFAPTEPYRPQRAVHNLVGHPPAPATAPVPICPVSVRGRPPPRLAARPPLPASAGPPFPVPLPPAVWLPTMSGLGRARLLRSVGLRVMA